MKKGKYNKVGILVGENAESEALSIRQALEYFGYEVTLKWTGRPNDFTTFLRGKLFDNKINIFILCFHGQAGKFVMPKLSKELYFEDEEKGNIGHKIIGSNLLFKNKVVISTACNVGNIKISKAFTNNKSTYIAPEGYIEGNAALIFVLTFMYNLNINHDIFKTFDSCVNIDNETSLFKLFTSNL